MVGRSGKLLRVWAPAPGRSPYSQPCERRSPTPLVGGEAGVKPRRRIASDASRLGLGRYRPRLPAIVESRRATDAPKRLLFSDLVRDLVPSHRSEQGQELLGAVQIELPRRRAKEKALEDRLAEISRLQQSAKLGVSQTEPNLQPESGLILPDQLGRRLIVACTDTAKELRE